MATGKKASLAIELDDLGRPARPTVPDPRKVGTRLAQRLLPQVPSASVRIRHTAGTTKRGSR
jgi:hypothetical protein